MAGSFFTRLSIRFLQVSPESSPSTRKAAAVVTNQPTDTRPPERSRIVNGRPSVVAPSGTISPNPAVVTPMTVWYRQSTSDHSPPPMNQ